MVGLIVLAPLALNLIPIVEREGMQKLHVTGSVRDTSENPLGGVEIQMWRDNKPYGNPVYTKMNDGSYDLPFVCKPQASQLQRRGSG